MASIGRGSVENLISPTIWIAHAIIGSIFACINGWLLKQEYSHIKNGVAKYTTKYLKWWALLCILCGALSQLFNAMSYIPILCHFIYYISNVLSLSQSVFMGFYQLSRLYYCFSISKLYSDRGYPQYLFYIMFGTGFMLLINHILYPVADGQIFDSCKLNETHYYFQRRNLIILEPYAVRTLWASIIRIIYWFWDLLTLYLYIRKVRMLKKSQEKQDIVARRIESIISRILIVTLFYQIPLILIILSWIVSAVRGWYGSDWYIIFGWIFLNAIRSFLFSFSVSLMLEHNTSRYIKFIKIVKVLKLHVLCFC